MKETQFAFTSSNQAEQIHLYTSLYRRIYLLLYISQNMNTTPFSSNILSYQDSKLILLSLIPAYEYFHLNTITQIESKK